MDEYIKLDEVIMGIDGLKYMIYNQKRYVIDVQPVRRGRWIWDSNAPHREHGAYKCNNCGRHSDFEENYCPECGARMMKDGDTE